MTNYIDNTTDDATTYKGKIDESLDLLRGVPVSSTTSGGSAGVDYEVSEWASLTLTTGIMYVFRAHTTNTGPCHVDQGGSPVNIKLADGSDPVANAIVSDGVYFLWYDGTNLVLVNPFSAALASAPLEDNDLAANGGAVLQNNVSEIITSKWTFTGNEIKLQGNFPSFYFKEDDTTDKNFAFLLTGSQLRIYESADDGTLGNIQSEYLFGGGVKFGAPSGGTPTTAGVINAEGLQVNGSPVLEDADLLDEDDFASNSATKAASQQSIKAYVDERGGKVATGSFTTSSIASGGSEANSVTHGLGTDNVLATAMAVGQVGGNTEDDWYMYIWRTDGASRTEFGSYNGFGSGSIVDTSAASGDVKFQIFNTAAISETFTIYYKIEALD